MLTADNFLLRFIALVVGVLICSSLYSAIFLTRPSPQPTAETDEKIPKNSYATCGVSNSFKKNVDDKVGVGVVTTFMEFPWQVYIHIEFRSGTIYNCGGSLIADRWVLTAASCLNITLKGDRLSEVRVSLGMHNYKMAMDSQKRDFSVGSQNFFIHPQYYSDDADIGLIKLPAAVTFSKNIRPICLADWNEHNYQGEPATIAGWSSTFKDDWFAYPHLAVPYKMKVIVDTQSKCKATFKSMTDEMMCTKGNGRAANGQCIISSPDIGSPLIFQRSNGKYRQIGILSFAKDCKSNQHLFYTKISDYAPWIQQTMKSSASQTLFSLSLFAIHFMVIYLKMY